MQLQYIPIAFLFGLAVSQSAQSISVETFDILNESAQTIEDLYDLEARIKKGLRQAPSSIDLHWRLARVIFAIAKITKKEVDQIRSFKRCAEKAEQIIKIFPERAEGYYFNALCRGRLAELDGLWSSLSTITPFKQTMEIAARLDPHLESGGPYRALGRLFQDLPALLGGNLNTATRHLKLAVQYGPDYPDNHLFLANVLYENNQLEEAQKALNAFFRTRPNADEKQRGQKLRKTIQTRLGGSNINAQGTQNP